VGHFDVDDSVDYNFASSDVFQMRGRVQCEHDVFVDVDKTLEVNDRNYARTINYSYHAGIEGPADRPIFRYDNAHRYVKEGHEDDHHRHRFDHATWLEIEPPEWVGRDQWPHPTEVIEELRAWWASTGQLLNLDAPTPAAERGSDGPSGPSSQGDENPTAGGDSLHL